jgi:hypothetical protein
MSKSAVSQALRPGSVMLQPQQVTDLVKRSFFGGSMPTPVYNIYKACI